jgi:hypothetical protein
MGHGCQLSGHTTHHVEVFSIPFIQDVFGIHLHDKDVVPFFHLGVVFFLPFFP